MRVFFSDVQMRFDERLTNVFWSLLATSTDLQFSFWDEISFEHHSPFVFLKPVVILTRICALYLKKQSGA